MSEGASTTCPYCGVGCGVDAKVVDNRDIIAVSGSPDHPANFGRLCVKGSALHETTGLEGRLLYPQIGGQRVAWESALDTVASGFQKIIREHGPNSVAFYLSGQLLTEDYYVANKLMKGFIGSANVDTNSRLCMASAVAGYKRAFGADAVPNCYEDLEHCDLLVVTGSNAAWTHPVLYQRIVAAKARRPEMKVVVIDPRRTATCDIADIHLPVNPGSDAFLFAGLLNFLATNGRVDKAYVASCTDGFEQALQAVSDLSADAVAEVTGIPADEVITFYRWFAETEKTLTFYSQGINQSSSGTDKCNAIINCHLATGRIGREGMGPFSITGQPNAMGGREVGGLATVLAAHMDFSKASVDRVGRFWGSENVASAPGFKAVDLFDAVERGEIKAIWIMGTNPVVSLPDSEKTRRALRQCELVVVSDCMERTDTSAFADVLLPVTGWGEKDGTVTNSERRISRQRALRSAPGEARHDWQVICEVAGRLGFGSAFDYAGPADIFREHAALSGFENPSAGNPGSRAFDISGLSNISDREYQELSPIQWPVNADHPTGRARLFTDRTFYTSNGRAQFVAVSPQLPKSQPNKKYPFILNTGRIRDQWHTMTRTGLTPRLLNHIDSPVLSMNPKDALAQGLSEGDLATITSGTGSLNIKVKLDAGIRAGQLFAPMHWNDQFASDGRIAKLIPSVTDPVSGQPESKFVAVSVARCEVKSWASLLSIEPLDMSTFDFWIRTPLASEAGAARYEVAMFREDTSKLAEMIERVVGAKPDVRFDDEKFAAHRMIFAAGGSVRTLAFLGRHHESLPAASWSNDLFKMRLLPNAWTLLAGKSPSGADKGRLVCSCYEVGENQIIGEILRGACTTRALGEKLSCGTNCGSCLPELRSLIAEHGLQEESAA